MRFLHRPGVPRTASLMHPLLPRTTGWVAGEEVAWAMVARHPNLVFQDPSDRRRASTEYLLLDQHTPVGKGFGAKGPWRA